MRDPESNPELGKAILEVVETQIRDNDPPETRRTVERLIAEGNSPKEARRLIAVVVSVEIFRMLKHRETFNRDRFVWNLNHLPDDPWDEDGTLLYPG